MTSLCIAMTEEQHKSMIIDCGGPLPQLHNAGKITAVNTSWCSPTYIHQLLRDVDVRGS